MKLEDEVKAEAKAMEMTGTTPDILEAFEQWEQERQALSEFYEISTRQQEMVTEIKLWWRVIRKAFWGKELISAETGRVPFETREIAGMLNAARKMETWCEDALDLSKRLDADKKRFKQLPLFGREAKHE